MYSAPDQFEATHNFSQRNWNSLESVELTITAYEDLDYPHRMKIVRFGNGTVKYTGGMSYDLLLAFQYALKFSYRPIEGYTWHEEHPNPNGTVLGMSGQIMNGIGDISIAQASMIMMMQPLGYISYLIPTSYGRLNAIFTQPRLTKDILCSAFSYQIWVCWLSVWILIFLTFLGVFYFTKYTSSNNDIEDRAVSGVMDMVLWCFATFACQGWHDQPKEASAKFIFFVAMIFAYLINIFFSASLTSNLATETIPIKAVSDLVSSRLTIYGDRRLPVVRSIVKEMYTEGRSKQFKSPRDVEQYYIRVNESLRLSLKTASAFITFEDAAKSIAHKQGYDDHFYCEKISTVRVSRQAIPSAMFVRRGSYLKEIFNRKIVVMLERGIVFRLNVIYNRKSLVRCPMVAGSYRGGLGFTDLTLAYYFAIAGILSSLISIVVEKWALSSPLKQSRLCMFFRRQEKM